MRCFSNDIGVIAQLVEHYVRNVGGAGSNPTNSTTQLSAPRSELNHFGALLFRRKFPQNRALAAFLLPVSDCL